MTREDAIYWIKNLAVLSTEKQMPQIEEALNMAVESLNQPKQGEWKIEESNSVWGKGYLLTCSECGESFRVTETALPYEHFCRNCGARMTDSEKPNNCEQTERSE